MIEETPDPVLVSAKKDEAVALIKKSGGISYDDLFETLGMKSYSPLRMAVSGELDRLG